jgi:light-regulated signal transduction histidine kinase (bacteriophytochrome)
MEVSRIPVPAPPEACIHLTSDSLHDLASPVNQIGAILELIVKKYLNALDDEAKVLFGFLQTSADRLRNLLGGLRTYEQLIGSPSACLRSDGNMLLAGVLSPMQNVIADSGAVVTHDSLPELYCDPSRMTYILTCLIENSIKFHGEARPEIHIRAVRSRGATVLSVRDNGIGIDPRYHERIFATFKRVDNERYRGAGIGLAIAKRMIEEQGGRIWVESELGKGATFFLSLPKIRKRAIASDRGRS